MPFPKDPAELQVISTVVSPQLTSSLHLQETDHFFENTKLGAIFPEVLSTSHVIQLVELASAKLLKPCLARDCDVLVTNRVDVKHLRPSAAGTRLITEVTYVGLEQEEVGNASMNLVAKFEGLISGYDGAGFCIARVDVWLSIVCKINIEANAILSIGTPMDVKNALTQAKTAWNTALANRRSELIHANKDALRDRIACERSKGGRYGFLSGCEHCIQH